MPATAEATPSRRAAPRRISWGGRPRPAYGGARLGRLPEDLELPRRPPQATWTSRHVGQLPTSARRARRRPGLGESLGEEVSSDDNKTENVEETRIEW